MTPERPFGCPGVPCHPQDRWLGEVELGILDLGVLAILRAFLQTFSDPASQGWKAAFATGRQIEAPSGPDVALGVLEALETMRRARVSTFRFSNPACLSCAAILSEHERRFVLVFRGLRLGHRSEALTHAMLLCEGNDTGPFIAALERLVEQVEPDHEAARSG